MLQSQSYIYQTRTFEVPPQFEAFAEASIDIAQQAHAGTLITNSDVRLSNDREAHRVFFERKLPEASRDYEFLAIHLGRTLLTVCMDHRHDYEDRPEEYQRTSLVFERGEVRAFHTNPARIGPMETITDNEEAGQRMTDRLFHSLGLLGVSTAVTPVQFQKAS